MITGIFWDDFDFFVKNKLNCKIHFCSLSELNSWCIWNKSFQIWRKELVRLKRMNLEIMKLTLNENAILFFRGIKNKSSEKWLFTGQRWSIRRGPSADARLDAKALDIIWLYVDLSHRARNRNKRKQGFKSDYKGIWTIIFNLRPPATKPINRRHIYGHHIEKPSP